MFILLMCSCKTKDVARNFQKYERFTSDISALNERVMKDTTKTERVEQTEEFTRIYESEIIIEYDTQNGVPSKVTKKEKFAESGNQTQTDESEERGLSESEKSKVNQSEDTKRELNTNESVKEESVWSGFTKSLGKWLGIGMVVVLFGLMIWKGIKDKLLL